MVNILHHLEKAWSAYRKFFPIIIAAVLIAAIPPLIITGFGFLAASNFSVSDAVTLVDQTYFSHNQSIWQENNLPLTIPFWFFAFVLVSAMLSLYLLAGTYGVCLGAIKGKTSLSLFFDSVKSRGPILLVAKIALAFLFGGMFLIMMIIGIICAALIGAVAGGLSTASVILVIVILILIVFALIAPLFTLISPSVVSGRGVTKAFGESINIGKRNYWDIVLLLIVLICLEIVASLFALANALLGMMVVVAFVSPMIALIISSYYLENSPKTFGRTELKPRIRRSEVSQKEKRKVK